MKTIKTIFYVLIILQTATFIFADTDPASPAKTEKPCGFPDDMNCFENGQIADAAMVNANYKALLERIQELTQIVCSYNPNHKICPDTQRIFRNSLGMTFMRIPAGTFMMGSPEDEPGRGGNEKLHEVTISKDFFIQTTEVTQGQWKMVMGSNPSAFSNCGDKCPVEMVNWNDVEEFIAKLNTKGEGSYRLPTEAEWEYSARAGTKTPFFFGNCLSTNQANYHGNYPLQGCPASGIVREQPLPVASFAPNAWGLYDMHGNVYEWCKDWYGIHYYESNENVDPLGPLTGTHRIIRGGNFRDYAKFSRSAGRNQHKPDKKDFCGFRLVFSL